MAILRFPLISACALVFRRHVSALLVSSFLLVGPVLAARGKTEAATVPAIVSQALSLAADNREEAISLLEGYLSNPSRELEPWVALYAGEQRRIANDFAAARVLFIRVRDNFAESPLHGSAIVGITLVDAGEFPSGNQVATLRLHDVEMAPDTLKADQCRLLAQAAASDGSVATDVQALASRAIAYAVRSGDPIVEARVQAAMRPLVDFQARNRIDLATTVDSTVGEAELDKAEAALLADDFEAARKIAQSWIATWPNGARRKEADYIVRRADAQDPVNPNVVGVLLPLSGIYAPPGERLKAVLNLANEQAGSPLRLIFRDDAGEPEKAVLLLEEMVLRDGVVAVMGPLLKETTAAVAEAAQALQVPLVTFSQAAGVTLQRPFVFRAFLTVEQQVNGLLGHVMSVEGLTRFAILAPENPYGHSASEAFTAGVTGRGGIVRSPIYYNPDKGDFRDIAQKLALAARTNRDSEVARLQSEAAAVGQDPGLVTLPPRADFQGIFIPDGYHRVALVASALAYEEFAIGAFKPHYGDTPLVVMGLNGWHDDRLSVEGGKYVRDGILVDAFDDQVPSPAVEAFVNTFRTSLEKDPGVVDAMGYDATRFIITAMQSGVTDRASMRDSLLNVHLAEPITGGSTFDENREIRRDLIVLKVGSAGIEIVNSTAGDSPVTP